MHMCVKVTPMGMSIVSVYTVCVIQAWREN